MNSFLKMVENSVSNWGKQKIIFSRDKLIEVGDFVVVNYQGGRVIRPLVVPNGVENVFRGFLHSIQEVIVVELKIKRIN